MADNFRLEKVGPGNEWDSLVQRSEDGTIFALSDYLVPLEAQPGLYLVYNNKELRAGVAVMEACDGRSAVAHDFVIYSGILFAPPTTGQNRAQRISEHFRVTEFVADELTKIYQRVEIPLSPSFVDVRPFLWVNYGTELPKYHVSIKYTSFVDVSDFAAAKGLDDISTYNEASKARRQTIRYARRDQVVTSEEFDPDGFIELYRKTMSRQDLEVGTTKLREMRNLLIALYRARLGRMFVARTRDGVVGSMAFFGVHRHRAYYLFGANDPELRSENTGTAVLWDAFAALSAEGVHEVDMEGVNSPKRGWFKLSFGGDLRPYYVVSYQG